MTLRNKILAKVKDVFNVDHGGAYPKWYVAFWYLMSPRMFMLNVVGSKLAGLKVSPLSNTIEIQGINISIDLLKCLGTRRWTVVESPGVPEGMVMMVVSARKHYPSKELMSLAISESIGNSTLARDHNGQ